MNTRRLFSALLALGLGLGSVAAMSADIANVRIINSGHEEAVEINLDELKVGESRQLAAASGTPAVVSRSAQGLSIEIAGKTTEVMLGEPGAAVWHEDGSHEVRIVELDGEHHAAGDGVKKRVIIRKHAGDAGDAHEVEIEELIGDGEHDTLHELHADAGGDGVQVIVTRKVVRESN